MALVDPELGKEYEHSDEMPHFAELQRFQTRLGLRLSAKSAPRSGRPSTRFPSVVR